jgi:hypothetical protein
VQVNTYIEDCISQKDPLIKVLRLMCMQSVCNNGLKQKVLDFYKREILQVVRKCNFSTHWCIVDHYYIIDCNNVFPL